MKTQTQSKVARQHLVNDSVVVAHDCLNSVITDLALLRIERIVQDAQKGIAR